MGSHRIYVENATMLDCAVLFDGQGPLGCSWFVDVFWEGSLQHDGVILDFSEARRTSKHTIDAEFDHRLLVHPRHVIQQAQGRTLIAAPWTVKGANQWFVLEAPDSSIRILPAETHAALEQGDTKHLAGDLARAVQLASSENISSVKTRLRSMPFDTLANAYRYTHSLKCHRGNCQRFHGHGGLLEARNSAEERIPELETCLKDVLFGKYVIARNYLASANDQSAIISRLKGVLASFGSSAETHQLFTYEGTQGEFAVAVPHGQALLLPEESTIENIAAYLRSWAVENGFPAVEVQASEGLQKGAIST